MFQVLTGWVNSIMKIRKLDEKSMRNFFNIISVSRMTQVIKKHYSIDGDFCNSVTRLFMTDLCETTWDFVEFITASEDLQSHNSIFHNTVMAL